MYVFIQRASQFLGHLDTKRISHVGTDCHFFLYGIPSIGHCRLQFIKCTCCYQRCHSKTIFVGRKMCKFVRTAITGIYPLDRPATNAAAVDSVVNRGECYKCNNFGIHSKPTLVTGSSKWTRSMQWAAKWNKIHWMNRQHNGKWNHATMETIIAIWATSSAIHCACSFSTRDYDCLFCFQDRVEMPKNW